MPKEDKPLTPEEREMVEQLQTAWRERIDKVLGPIYGIFEWCWPVTIALFAFQQIFRYFNGTLPYSFWIVTMFLWAPLVLSMAFTAMLVTITYLFAFISSWHKFLFTVGYYLKMGFKDANKGNE